MFNPEIRGVDAKKSLINTEINVKISQCGHIKAIASGRSITGPTGNGFTTISNPVLNSTALLD